MPPSGSAPPPGDGTSLQNSARDHLAFGPYRLDPLEKRLLRDDADLSIPVRHFELLYILASRAGETVSKDELTTRVWPDQFVLDGTLTQAMYALRMAIDATDTDHHIVTQRGRGYRFVAPVKIVQAPPPRIDIEALLAPHRTLTDGRATLESMDRERLPAARAAFETLVAHHPNDARFRIGLANVCALQFESTRADLAPDIAALGLAAEHGRRACELAPQSGEAWATYGFILDRTGRPADAEAALSRAIALEPGGRFHHLRLASATWGEPRLRALRRALTLLPGAPLAHVLASMVFVARDALGEAEREIDAGRAALPDTVLGTAGSTVVAIHFVKGLLCLARGDDEAAAGWFRRELALESQGHMYAKESCGYTWYLMGAYHLRRGETAAARKAFEQARARVPRHPLVHAGLALLGAPASHRPASTPHATVDHAIAEAIVLVAAGDTPGAVRVVTAALESAPPGHAGWLIPLDPVLGVQQARDAWAGVLRLLRRRAE